MKVKHETQLKKVPQLKIKSMVIVSLFFVHDWFILAFKISDLITFANISAKFPRGRFQSNNNNKAWKKKRKSGNYNHTFNHYVLN